MIKHFLKPLLLVGLIFSFSPLKAEKIKVSVDQRVEALSILQYLAGRLDLKASSYADSVKNHFKPYRDHPAVQLTEEMMRVGKVPKSAHSESNTLGLYLDEDFEMHRHFTQKDSAGYGPHYGIENMYEWLNSAQAFVEDSRYQEFREKMTPFYERWEQQVHESLKEGETWVENYETLFGLNKQWVIVLNPLKKIQSAHAVNSYTQAHPGHYCFSFSYRERVKDSVVFRKDARKWQDLFWHEGGHLMMGKAVYVDYKEELAEYEEQFEVCRDRIRKTKGYSTWTRYLDELIGHGLAVYMRKEKEPELYELHRLNMKVQGFNHLDVFLQAMEDYEAENQGNPFREHFFPLFLENLEKVEQGKIEVEYDYAKLMEKGKKMMKRLKEEGKI